MSTPVLEVAELRRNRTWTFAARADRGRVRWWPTSLPGSGQEDVAPRPRPNPQRRRIRRGRIELILA